MCLVVYVMFIINLITIMLSGISKMGDKDEKVGCVNFF